MPVNIIDTLKPKNGLNFPVVEAIDVFVEDYENLADAISHFATDAMIEAINIVLSGKANTSDVNTAVANLQGQINQIVISASAEAVVAPEVAAARVGDDGTEYTTLKERLDAENTALTEAVSNTSADVTLFQSIPTATVNGKYISASTGAQVTNSAFSFKEVSVLPGMSLRYSCGFAEGVAGYAFYNEDTYLSGGLGTAAAQIITVPDTATICRLTYHTDSPPEHVVECVSGVGELVGTLQALNNIPVLNTRVNGLTTDVNTAYNGGSRIVSMTTDKWQLGKRVSGYTTVDGKKYPNVGDFAGTNMLIIPLGGLSYIHASADLTWNAATYSPIEITATDGTFIDFVARDALINETAELPWLTYVTTGGYKIDVEKLREAYGAYELGSIYICQSKTETAEWSTEAVVKGLAELTNIVDSLDLEQLRDFVLNGADLSSEVTNWTVGYRVSAYTVVDGKKVPNVLAFDGCKYAIVDVSSSVVESVESDADLTWGEAAYTPIVIVDSNGSVSVIPAWYISKDELINETAVRSWLEYKQGGGYKIDVRKLKETYPDYAISQIYICQANSEVATWTVKQNILGLTEASADIFDLQAAVKELNTDPFIVVPKESIALVGHEWNMYFENVIGGYTDLYFAKARCTDADSMNGKLYEDVLRFTPSAGAVGDHTVYISIYSAVSGNLVTETTFTLHVLSDDTITGKKAIFIGDSLTDDGYYPCEIQGHLSNGGITSIGTRSDTREIDGDTITASNEGRGGWTSSNYMNDASVGGVDNAFFNPTTETFDFSYYMSQNSFSDVDVVSIYLGTNADSSFDVTLSNLDAMIDSIHKYSSSIKVIICLYHQVANQSGCGNHNGLQVSKEMSIDRMQKNQVLISRYENNPDYPNVHIAELNFSVDGNNDYAKVTQPLSARNPETIVRLNNNVHPNVYGYLKIADVLYNRIRYILDEGE